MSKRKLFCLVLIPVLAPGLLMQAPSEIEAAMDGTGAPRDAAAEMLVRLAGPQQLELTEPLVLSPPLTLEVGVRPEVDPQGEPWTVWVARSTTGRNRLAGAQQVVVPVDGRVDLPGLSPGAYFVRLMAADGTTWFGRPFELTPDEPRLDIELDLLWVQGRVRLGDEPLQARLLFGGRVRPEQVLAESDEEGRFSLVLPEPGEWAVEVQSQEPAIKRVFGRLDVPPSENQEPVELSIDLPQTRLTAIVVDSAGDPVSRAMVEAQSLMRPIEAVRVPVNEEGEIEIVGLPEGTLHLRALAPGSESEQVAIVLQEDIEPPPARLVLEKRRTVSGTVMSETGPVAGAFVSMEPVEKPSRPTMARVVTGEDGAFELSLPAATRQVLVRAGAPGWTMRAWRLTLDSEARRVLHLHRLGGSVRLQLGPTPDLVAPRHVPILFHGDSYLGLALLREWAFSTGAGTVSEDGWTIPDLEVGEYRFCRLSVGEVLAGYAMQPAAVPAERCDVGWLAPGGELELSLPIAG